MSEAFVYCWTDHKNGMLYVGSHKGTVDDGYICSSKMMLEEYKKRPTDFTRQILAEGSFIDIRKLEEKILTTVNVKMDEQFYNMHNGNGNFYNKGHTEEYKRRQSVLLKGKKKSNVSNMKKPKSLEHKKKLSASKKGKKTLPFSDSHKKNISLGLKKLFSIQKHHFYGKKHSDSTKSKIGNIHSENWIIETPNGNKIEIYNLSKYCRENALNQSCMSRVAKGIKKQHKGYKISKQV